MLCSTEDDCCIKASRIGRQQGVQIELHHGDKKEGFGFRISRGLSVELCHVSDIFLCPLTSFLDFSFSVLSFFLLHNCMKIISYHLLNKLCWYFNTEPLWILLFHMLAYSDSVYGDTAIRHVPSCTHF